MSDDLATKTAASVLRTVRLLVILLVFPLAGLNAQDGASEIQLELEYPAFSPNSDGFQDTLTIEADDVPRHLRVCDDWRLDIVGPGGAVRSFVADRREIRASRGITNLFLPGSLTPEPIRVFEELIWDGRDNDGRFVFDGQYQITLRITEQKTGQIHQVGPVGVVVHTQTPQVSVSAPVAILVRPRDEQGNVFEDENKILIAQSASGGAGLTYTGSFLDEDGDEVETQEWADQLPGRIEWNGRSGSSLADYGVYRFRLEARDAAGNRARFEIDDLMIVDRKPLLDLQGESYRLSPDGNRNQDTLRLEPVYLNGLSTDSSGFFGRVYQASAWEFGIYSKVGAEKPVFGMTGQGGLPGEFVWQGLNDAGSEASDGLYYARLSVQTSAGAFESVWKPVYLDRSPPGMSLGVAGHRISPDGDDDDETQRISVSASDETEIRRWALYIFVAPETKGVERRLLRTYRGTNFLPEPFYWDGRGDTGEQVESNEEIAFQLEVEDGAGNVRLSDPRIRTTDVLFRPLNPGGVELESNLPMRDYFDESGFLTGKGRSVSRAILSKLARYKRYFVHLEVHAPLPGTEEENMRGTEAQAGNLYDYWKEGLGYPREGMGYRGFGETEPIGGERADPFSNYRNGRIRIYLTPREDLRK